MQTHSGARHIQDPHSEQGIGILPFLETLGVFAIIVALILAARRAYKRAFDQRRELLEEEKRDRHEIALETISKIEQGRISEISALGMVKLPSERFVYASESMHGQTHKTHVYKSSSPALYVPLGHGFRARVGGSAGQSGTQETFMWDAKGVVYVSNLRICFKPHDHVEIVSIPFGSVISYDIFDNGLALSVERLGVQQFQTGDPALGLLFKGIIEQTISV